MIQTILTPIDGSAHARAALELSIDLAAKYDAKIVLLHAGIRGGSIPEELYDVAVRELREAASSGRETGVDANRSQHLQVLEYLGRMLLRKAHKQAEDRGVSRVETVFDYGDAGDCILDHARQSSADLIVMGSRGLSDLEGLFLGSTSHKVFHLAPCSCVTVHHGDDKPDVGGIGKILVATDGSAPADKAVDLASDIAAKTGAALELLYVTSRGPSLEKLRASIDMDRLSSGAREELDPARHPVAEHMGSAWFPPVISKETATEIGRQVLERGRQTAEAKGVAAPSLLLLDGDDPARVISGAVKREQADLIAMGSRGLGAVEGILTGSVSYKVSHAVRCNCMIVR